jgi:hypothetical protein
LHVKDPVAWHQAGACWTVVATGTGRGDWISTPEVSLPARAGDEILLDAAYSPTTWRPAKRFVITAVEEEIDLPLWNSGVTLTLLAALVLLFIATLYSFRIRVRGSSFGPVSGFHTLGLGRLLGERELVVEIRKSPKGCSLIRSPRDRSGLRVAVFTRQGFRTKVGAGMTVPLGCGDQVQIESYRLNERISVLSSSTLFRRVIRERGSRSRAGSKVLEDEQFHLG